MISLSSLTSNQLKRAAAIQEQIESLHLELSNLLDGSAPVSAPAAVKPRAAQPSAPPAPAPQAPAPKRGGRRKISPAGLARIRAAQKIRWAKVHAAAPAAASAKKKTRKMSPAARAKIAAVAKARWAAIKAAGKKRL